ncbi:hypothetical protein DUI87_08940 [Hirundo rustica rustica]|uniref:Uncharacterized protein n=1 Tax=Hirundo rustica rustica TaxID=333673 RepID=A0A3M0L3B6_HIRRU|nr:hypothetical protein DUI87_08940 [Hirundo rustica rustica]
MESGQDSGKQQAQLNVTCLSLARRGPTYRKSMGFYMPLFPQLVVVVFQNLAFHLIEACTTVPGPSTELVQIPVWNLPALQQINTPTPLIACKLTERALYSLIPLISKDIKQDWP